MPSPFPSWSAAQLRRDLNDRAYRLARLQGLLHDTSTGPTPAVLFGREEQNPHQPARHGNFHPAAYARICAHPDWIRRLAKVHTASRRSSARHDWRWMELDSASSSDALLMNILCHPEVFDGTRLAVPVAALLNVDPASQPCFGTRPGVPLRTQLRPRTKSSALRAAVDRTEIDLTLGNLYVEAKLTESDFQLAAPTLIERYRDLETVFDTARLPRQLVDLPPRKFLIPPPIQTRVLHSSRSDRWDAESPYSPDPDLPESFEIRPPPKPRRIQGYQLVRNVLAAYAAGASFCVLCDARRHDLIEIWYSVLSAVHAPDFGWRLKLLTWQELAATLPADLQAFLDAKYGITP
jgi:hypothetical protein